MDDAQEQAAPAETNRARPRGGVGRLARWWFEETDRWFWQILALALLIRLAYGLPAGLGPPLSGRPFLIDEQEYYATGQMLAAGHGFAFYDTFAWTRAPLYPLLVGAVFRLAGPDPVMVLTLQALLSTITLYWLATLAGRVAVRHGGPGGQPASDGSGEPGGPGGHGGSGQGGHVGPPLLSFRAARRMAVLIGAVWLPFTLFSQLLLSETLFLTLFVAALMVLARWATWRRTTFGHLGLRHLLLAGVLLGLAALTRSTALAFVPLAAGWVAAQGLGVRGWGLAPRDQRSGIRDQGSIAERQNPQSAIRNPQLPTPPPNP